MYRIALVLALVFAFSGCDDQIGSEQVPAARAPKVVEEASVSLMAPLSADNSVRILLNGRQMRVPKALFGNIDIKNIVQPLELDHLYITVWYPEMTVATWLKSDPQDKDHFKIFLPWTVYVEDYTPRYHGRFGLISPNADWDLRLEAGVPEERESPFKQLANISFLHSLLKDPVFKNFYDQNAQSYGNRFGFITRENAEFEADISCGKIIYCRGNVVIKNAKLRYSLTFGRPGGTEHLLDAITSINRMYSSWLVAQ